MDPAHSQFFKRAAPPIVAAIAAAAATLIVNASVAGCHGQTKPSLYEPAQVLIERDPDRKARDYIVSQGDCRLSWIVFESSPNRGVMQNRSVCSRPLSEQTPALSRVLAAVLKDSEGPERPHTFVWGRLTPDKRQDDLEMAFRLALAAHRSSSWDAKQGRPRSGHINAFVVRLANQNMIYSELRQLFDACGLELRFADAEKVLVMSAGKLIFFDQLKALGVEATEKLPFDCLAYFAISKKP